MKKVIEKYRVFIFIWVLICVFALSVNIFNINLKIDTSYLFTSGINSETGFWPFVKFNEYTDVSMYNGGKGIGDEHLQGYSTFNGIFYKFDFAEFLLYMGILAAFLVYKAYIAKPVLKPIH